MSRIGIDLDGVLYDFGTAFGSYLIQEHNWDASLCTPPTRWEFYEDWGISLPGFKAICTQAADRGLLWGTQDLAEVGAAYALQRLREFGHTIHIITHRNFGSHPSVSHSATAIWLGRHSIPYDTLTFSGDKTIVPTDYMIEDNADNYLALDATSCVPFLIDRPWNQHIDARRVGRVRDFVDIILEDEAP